ncbi:S-layer homology domain-containing protein [Cohnella lupini]|nr:S-layer homology domain-containing protein [Cohnella lupini]
MKKGYSKVVSGLLAASLLGTGVSWTTTSASAASPFKDVKQNYWAEKHIMKLALQGIFKGGTGKDAGKFFPEVKLSRQDAVLIALRLMGVEDEVDHSIALVFPSNFVMKEDYKPYIKLALQKKIIMIDEEVALAAKEKDSEWGKSFATREWMTKLLVRAIGKDAEAKLAATQATAFSDDTAIDPKLKGYVNVAVSLGIISGIKSKDVTKFDPLAPVTREMASTLFSRAESEIEAVYPGQVSGVLMSSSATKITLLNSTGETKEYTLSPTAAIYGYQSDTITPLANLKQYGEVTLLTNSDSSVGFVEQTNETPKVKTIDGTLISVVKSKLRLTMSVNGVEEDYYYDSKNMPTITDAGGQALTIDNLPVNAPVKLMVDAVRAEGKIVSIAVNQSVTNKTGTGTVVAWNAATRALQVKDTASGNSESYSVAANATIKLNGANLTFDQLKVGDAITYEVKTGTVAGIVVTKTEQPTVSGVLEAVVKSNNTIQYTVNNNLEAKRLADTYTVKIEGYSDVTIDDLVKGDAVSLSLNESGKVYLITVTNRSVSTLYSATVIQYVAKAKTLIVNDGAAIKTFFITPTTRFDLNGTLLSLDSAASFISTEGKKISIGYSGDNAVYISVIARYSGKVLEINQSAKTIKLSLDASSSVTVPYVSPNVEIYGQTMKTPADVKIGDTVTLILGNASQDQATAILVQKTLQLEIVSVDAVASKLGVRRSDGIVEVWSINSSMKLQDENGTTANLSTFTPGNLVNVSFQGNTAMNIKSVSATYGKVSSVNVAASTVDIVSSTGVVSTKSLGTSPKIIRDNAVQSSLSVIQPDDRVEIRKDEADRVTIEVIPVSRRTVFQFETISQRLFVKEKEGTSNTNASYNLDPKIYIHQGTNLLTVNDLHYDDALSLYVLRGKIFEIVK